MAILDEDRLGNRELSEMAVQEIKGLGGWKMFVSILFIIVSGFGLLSILGSFGMISTFRMRGEQATIYMVVMFLYLVIFGIALAMYIILLRSAISFNAFAKTRNMSDLEKAFSHRRKFWMILGIFMLIFLVIYVGILFISLAGGMR